MERSGLPTAVDLLNDDDAPFEPAEQLPLLPAVAPQPEKEPQGGQGLSSGGPGRPKGARNKSTEEWRRYLLSRYPSPLVGLCEIFSRPVAELRKELGCDEELEAFKIQVDAMKAALPYLHQRQPQAIELDTSGEIHLTINRAPVAGLAGPSRTSVRILDGEIITDEENDEKSKT